MIVITFCVGLKQAPQAWFHRLHDYLILIGFCPSKTDVSFFVYTVAGSMVFLLVYVDDIILMGSDDALVVSLLVKSTFAFKIRDPSPPSFFLGIETMSVRDVMALSQRQYMEDLLKRVGMFD